jgi:hypothetical protein
VVEDPSPRLSNSELWPQQRIARSKKQDCAGFTIVREFVSANVLIENDIREIMIYMAHVVNNNEPTPCRSNAFLVSRVEMVTVKHDPISAEVASSRQSLLHIRRGGMRILQ